MDNHLTFEEKKDYKIQKVVKKRKLKLDASPKQKPKKK